MQRVPASWAVVNSAAFSFMELEDTKKYVGWKFVFQDGFGNIRHCVRTANGFRTKNAEFTDDEVIRYGWQVSMKSAPAGALQLQLFK